MSASEMHDEENGGETAEAPARRFAGQSPDGGHGVPLFLSGGADGRKGDAQDEKDEVGE